MKRFVLAFAAFAFPPLAFAAEPAEDIEAWSRRRLLGWSCALAALLYLQWKRRPLKTSFAVDDGVYAPGAPVHAVLFTEERPESLKAVCELYREDDDRPLREIPVTIGEPRRDDDGWRTPVGVALPADARPAFDGGWAFTVTGTVRGRKFVEGDDIELEDADEEPGAPSSGG